MKEDRRMKLQKKKFNSNHLLAIFIVVCGLLAGISVFAGGVLTPVKNIFFTVLSPMQEGINSVGNAVFSWNENAKSKKTLRAENERLQEKIDVLKMQNRVLQQNQVELERLQDLLKLKQKYKKYHTVELIESSTNLGFAAANNLALEKVSTPYICYLNPDVILTEDIITPSIEILKKRNDVGIVSCKLKNRDGSDQRSYFNYTGMWSSLGAILHIGAIMPQGFRKKYFLNEYHAKTDFEPEWVIGAEMILRTEEAKKIGGFSEEYFMYTI